MIIEGNKALYKPQTALKAQNSEDKTGRHLFENDENAASYINETANGNNFDGFGDSYDGLGKMFQDMLAKTSDLSESSEKYAVAVKLRVLGSLLTRIEMMQGHMYSSRSWEKLMKAYGRAKPISLEDDPDTADINKAIDDVVGALSSLERAEIKDDKRREPLPLVMKIGGTASEQAAVSTAASAVITAAVPWRSFSIDVSV